MPIPGLPARLHRPGILRVGRAGLHRRSRHRHARRLSGASQQERIRLRQDPGSPGGQAPGGDRAHHAGGHRSSRRRGRARVARGHHRRPGGGRHRAARHRLVSEGIIISTDEVGKYKMLVQTFALVGLMLHYPYLGIDFFVAGMYFLWLSTVLAVWSGVQYHVRVPALPARRIPELRRCSYVEASSDTSNPSFRRSRLCQDTIRERQRPPRIVIPAKAGIQGECPHAAG